MKCENGEENSRCGMSKRQVIICSVAAALLIAAVSFWILVVDNISEELTVEAGMQDVDADAFVLREWGLSASFVTDLSTVPLSSPGDYPVQLRYCGCIFDSVIRVRDTVAPDVALRDLSVLSVIMPEPSDFVLEMHDVTQVQAVFVEEPDLSIEGNQTVTISFTDEGGNVTQKQAVLEVIFDTEGPVMDGIESYTIYLGEEVDYLSAVSITDNEDEMPVLTVDDSALDLTKGGEYEIIYTGRDISGNETVETAIITVIDDQTDPSIRGIKSITVYVGESVSYRKGISVVDDYDNDPTLTVDSSRVDLKKAGKYEVIYVARDEAGNETRESATVNVKERPAGFVDEAQIYAAADELLSKIVSEGMSDHEKVKAVYRWLQGNCRYSGSSDKSNWLQAAYVMMSKKSGDCFNYYALSRLLFERMGIPNITVRKVRNHAKDSNHYWSLVSIDGGSTYYHFDSTPRSGSGDNFCLVTDEFLDAYSASHNNSHNRDKSLYPATPASGP